MVLAVDDVLMVKETFSQDGNLANMVAFFEVTGIVGDPVTIDEFARWYHIQFGAEIVQWFLHETANYETTLVEFINGDLDFGSFTELLAGSIVGEPAASFNAISVKQNVSNRMTRSGFKRLPFIGEFNMQGNNAQFGGGGETAVEQWFGAPNFIQNPDEAPDTAYVAVRPVIVGRIEEPPDSGHYVLDPTRINPVASANVIGITSQVSRKV